MNCPKCGNPRAAYVESRRKYWGGKKGTESPKPRTNFKAKCKCGYTWEEVPSQVMEVEQNEVETTT